MKTGSLQSIVQGNHDGSKGDTEGNRKANINTFEGDKRLMQALMTLVKQATWHVIEEDIFITVKGFRWTITIESTSNRELGEMYKGGQTKVVEIQTKAKSLPKKLDKVLDSQRNETKDKIELPGKKIKAQARKSQQKRKTIMKRLVEVYNGEMNQEIITNGDNQERKKQAIKFLYWGISK